MPTPFARSWPPLSSPPYWCRYWARSVQRERRQNHRIKAVPDGIAQTLVAVPLPEAGASSPGCQFAVAIGTSRGNISTLCGNDFRLALGAGRDPGGLERARWGYARFGGGGEVASAPSRPRS